MNLEDCDSPDRLQRHTVKQAYILILLDAIQPLQRPVYLFYCYVAFARRRARRWGAYGGGEWERGGGISCRHAHSLLTLLL